MLRVAKPKVGVLSKVPGVRIVALKSLLAPASRVPSERAFSLAARKVSHTRLLHSKYYVA